MWAEQTDERKALGKEGKGVVTIAGEPLLHPRHYGQDRWFVYLEAQGDEGQNEGEIAAIRDAGFPVLELRLEDDYDLGAEFFRWEFATAVAGAILGINPFDQPDVQASKDNTDRALGQPRGDGRPPVLAEQGSLPELLEQAAPGDYLAVMAFIEQTGETDALLSQLRRRVAEKMGIATTLGYGPRFLHSTGQLHKGGPGSGLFLQLTSDREDDLPIPGETYGFRALAQAQALGDLEALESLGRRTARVNLGADPPAGLRNLLESLD